METIETSRLLLETPQIAHCGAMAALANNLEISRWLATMPWPYSLDDALHFVEIVSQMKRGSVFSLLLKETGQFVGCCGSGPVDDKDEIDFGYWLGVDYWGNGYASEAACAVLDHVFEKDRFDMITTDCQRQNLASLRVLEKLGFRNTGSRTSFCLATGQTVETLKMQLGRHGWAAQKQQRAGSGQ